MSNDLYNFIKESNKIEGIFLASIDDEITAAEKFLSLKKITVESLCEFVEVCQPGARLRLNEGMNVHVGDHVAPLGGEYILPMLEGVLGKANGSGWVAYGVHREYETLHPFTDGNGRSGRILWLWMMHQRGQETSLGFLHHWYYQSLRASR